MIENAREHERRLRLLGTDVRLLIGPPIREELPSPEVAALQIEGFLRMFHRALTRFEPESELCALNRDTDEVVSASPLLLTLVSAGLWAFEASGGLVDPTLLAELERAGYRRSREGLEPASLRDAIAAAPPRRPAHPAEGSPCAQVLANPEAGVVLRPRGVRVDSGGIGKGLAADLADARLGGYASHVIDAGGDLRIGGEDPRPRRVDIDHPLDDGPAHAFSLERGAVATSGIATRLWWDGQRFAHHLIDPCTGEPAWTGIIQATAVGETALEAETLAKTAFLSGPERAAGLLEPRGGVLVLDDGEVVVHGRLEPVPELLEAAA